MLGVLILLPALGLAQGLTVVVSPEATVSGSYITLGDVAVITGAEPDRIEALRQTQIGDAPAAGRSLVLSKDLFNARLFNKGIDLSGINWEIPGTIKITAASQLLSGDVITEEAKRYLLGQFSDKNSQDLTVSTLSNQPDLHLAPGHITLKAGAQRGTRPGAFNAVDVNVLVNGELKTTAVVRFKIDLLEDVVVTAKVLAPGAVLTADNLKMEKRNVAKSSGIDYVTDLNKVLGLAVKRGLAAGVILDNNLVNKPVIVKRGQEVIITAKAQGLEIAVPGLAMQEGYEGQVIRIQNKTSKKFLSAKVIDADTVRVIVPGGG